MENIIEKNPFSKKEIIFHLISILLLSLITFSFMYLIPIKDDTIIIKMNTSSSKFIINKSIFLPSLLTGFIISLIYSIENYFLRFNDENVLFKYKNNLVSFIILFLLGVLAYLVIDLFLFSFKLNYPLASFLSSVITLIYIYIICKLYMYNYIEDKNIFFEIIRFAIVGIIASLFDFATCFIFEKYILYSLANNPLIVTIISVSAGFLVGVIVNYLCSIYMVFKNTTSKNKSKTSLGRLLFFIFAAVGLFMGIGLQYLFYNYLKFGFVITFIIRTLIVLIWNYLSRKYFIFK